MRVRNDRVNEWVIAERARGCLVAVVAPTRGTRSGCLGEKWLVLGYALAEVDRAGRKVGGYMCRCFDDIVR